MGFFDSLFSKKPSKQDITAFSYYLFFDYIPKQLNAWEKKNASFQSVLNFEPLVQKNPVWKSLIKQIKVTDSTLKKCTDVTLYLIQAPSNEMMGEVASAIIAVNPKIRKYEYYTMEYSLGGFAICSADESGNHFYMDDCKDGNQFGAYVIKCAMETLIPSTKARSQSSSTTSQSSSVKYTAEKLLKALEKITEQYYQERKVVSLNDWLVTQKIGDDFKFYVTQYPDEEFDKPNYEVTLMVDAMDHNGRLGIVNKFFPKQTAPPKPAEDKNSTCIPNIIGKFYSLDQLTQEQMGKLRLQPIDAGLVFNDTTQNVIKIFAEQSPKIKKYLPNLDLSSNEAIAAYFLKLCQKTEMGYEFGYSIKMNSAGDAGVIGFIFVHTPEENQYAIGFPEWTVDFCLFEPLEGKGIMRNCLLRVMRILKTKMGVKELFAIVDENNAKCLKLLFKLPFDCRKDILVNPATGERANLFVCDLTKITFQQE